MAKLLDTEATRSELKEKMAAFRDGFVKKIPVGSVVVNTNLYDDRDDSMMWAKTSQGEIYDDINSNLVNVKDIDGIKGNDGIWTAAFCRLA